jgi:hypothetical protein
MKFELDINGANPRKTNLKLDGKSVPFMSAEVRVAYNEIPKLIIELDVIELSRTNGEVEIIVAEPTRELLIAAGWTPPDAQE